MGTLRLDTSEPQNFTFNDINFVYALAQISGMSTRLARYSKGLLAITDLDFDLIKELRSQGSVRNFESRRTDLYELRWLK